MRTLIYLRAPWEPVRSSEQSFPCALHEKKEKYLFDLYHVPVPEGIEPSTSRLTVARSAAELRNPVEPVCWEVSAFLYVRTVLIFRAYLAEGASGGGSNS